MKNIRFQLFTTLLVLILVASSCKKEMPDKPIVTLTEVGHDNCRQAHPGHDLHLEADVRADGITQRIDIEIHQENGGHFEIRQAFADSKYAGLRNLTFHEHIDIPADAPTGEYHLHFTVTDQHGQQTTAACDIEMTNDNEDEHEH